MADERKERIARNENAFRALNESLGTSVHRGRLADDHLAGFVCECGDPGCEQIVHVGMAAYESIRADAMHFLLVPGHEAPDAEDIVETGAGHIVVRKHDDVSDIVEQGDPRTDS